MAWIDPDGSRLFAVICLAAAVPTWFILDALLFEASFLRSVATRYKRRKKLGRSLAVSSRDQSKQLLLDVAGKYRHGPLAGHRFKRMVRPKLPDGMDN